MIAISSIDYCVSCTMVVFLIKECEDTGMACKWDVGVYFTECDQLLSTLLSRIAHEGYGYKYPFDLKSSRWLTSNSLYFDAGLSEFLIQWWKIFEHNQVLKKSVCESRWNWSLRISRS